MLATDLAFLESLGRPGPNAQRTKQSGDGLGDLASRLLVHGTIPKLLSTLSSTVLLTGLHPARPPASQAAGRSPT